MSYLIKDTTKEDRKKYVEKALGISLSGAVEPSDKLKFLINEYIEGNIELNEIKKLIVKEYNKNG